MRRPDAENGCCYCMVETGGERTFIVDHGIEYTFYETYLKNIDTASIFAPNVMITVFCVSCQSVRAASCTEDFFV